MEKEKNIDLSLKENRDSFIKNYQAITSNQLTPRNETILPTTPTFDNSKVEGNVNDFTAKNKTDAEIERLRTESNKGTAEISNLIKDIGITTAKEGEFLESEGGYEAKKQYDEYASQLEQEQLRLRRETDRIRADNPTGGFGGALSQQLADIERKSLSKQADIAILGNAAGRRYDTAVSIAKNKVEMLLAPKKAELEGLKFIQENNKAFQTAEFNNLLSRKNNEYVQEQKKLETIENIKIEAVKNGFKNVAAFEGVDNINDALKVAGSYLVSPKEKLELEKLSKDIKKTDLELALIEAKSTLGGSTGDPILDVISASSKFEDKRLTDSQLEKIQKAQQALGSMETLQGLLLQGKDGIKTTGPISGRVRTLISQIGGDADARAINSTIQGLIPTVARGIFGEVGVLTDKDIDNYRKTVPNLNSTEAQNKLVSIIMYDVLSRSLESTLVTNAQNQTNVSGFVSTYTDIKNRINTLKEELGVPETSNIDPINRTKLEIGWGNSTIDISGVLNNYLK